MRQTLGLKLSQSLALTPQLQQSIALLSLSSSELESEIVQAAQENPFIDFQPQRPAHQMVTVQGGLQATAEPQTSGALDFGSAAFTRTRDDNDEPDYQASLAQGEVTLREVLSQQLRLKKLPADTQALLQLLIEDINPAGYVESTPEQLCQIAARLAGTTTDAVSQRLLPHYDRALAVLQGFDPPGVGARSLAECLALQLSHACPAECVLDSKARVQQLALRIVQTGFEALAKRNRAALQQLAADQLPYLDAALRLITQLDPKPGLVYGDDTASVVSADVRVVFAHGAWQAQLVQHPAMQVQVNQALVQAAQDSTQTLDEPMQKSAQAAKQWVRSIHQHFETLLKVATVIVHSQQAYFYYGAMGLKPLRQKDVAAQLDLHESTVSRITTNKFIETPHGVLEMKYFFTTAIVSDEGASTSAEAIRSLLSQLIAKEPTHKPHSDSNLAIQLDRAGFEAARRTVAKYREQLGIPPAQLRKPFAV